MAINAKLGDSAQDSYVTLAYAEAYFTNRRNITTWSNLTTSEKEAVLKQASRDIDIHNFIGKKYYESQSMEFPRDDYTVVIGKCATPITTTSFRNSNLYSSTYGVYPTNYWQYGCVHITEATPLGDTRTISYSNSVNGSITVDTAFTATPTENTSFLIFEPLPKEIRDATCEQALFILDNTNIDSLQTYQTLGAEQVKIGDVAVTFKTGTSSKIAIAPVARRLLSKWIKKTITIGRA